MRETEIAKVICPSPCRRTVARIYSDLLRGEKNYVVRIDRVKNRDGFSEVGGQFTIDPHGQIAWPSNTLRLQVEYPDLANPKVVPVAEPIGIWELSCTRHAEQKSLVVRAEMVAAAISRAENTREVVVLTALDQ